MVNMKTIGVFAGSFNPFHIGHLDILKQSEQLFDKVIVARGFNTDKDMIDDKITSKYINTFYSGLLTDYINSLESVGCRITLIRGLRDSKDLEYEQQQLFFMKELKPDFKVVFIVCDPKYKYISSSAIRTLIPFNKHLKYIP